MESGRPSIPLHRSHSIPKRFIFLYSPSRVIPSRRAVSVRRSSQRSSARRISHASMRARLSFSVSPSTAFAWIGSRTPESRGERSSRSRTVPGVGEREHALHLVLELAHVARPRVGEQEAHRVAREAAAGLALARAVEREEVLGEREDVLAPRARAAARAIGNTARR